MKLNITYFKIADRYLDGIGGYAYLTSGGIGCSSVGFHIQSKKGERCRFKIKVFGLYCYQNDYTDSPEDSSPPVQ